MLDNDGAVRSFFDPGLRLSDLTLTGGRVGGAGEDGGGGIQNNEGSRSSADVVVRDNLARSDAVDNVPGGGIWSTGHPRPFREHASAATSPAASETRRPTGAGIFVADGGLVDPGRLARSSATRPSSGTRGHGARLAPGACLRQESRGRAADTVTVTDSTIAEQHRARRPALGRRAASRRARREPRRSASTISGNRSKARRRPLRRQSADDVNIDNSTFSGNSAQAGRRGDLPAVWAPAGST